MSAWSSALNTPFASRDAGAPRSHAVSTPVDATSTPPTRAVVAFSASRRFIGGMGTPGQSDLQYGSRLCALGSRLGRYWGTARREGRPPDAEGFLTPHWLKAESREPRAAVQSAESRSSSRELSSSQIPPPHLLRRAVRRAGGERHVQDRG